MAKKANKARRNFLQGALALSAAGLTTNAMPVESPGGGEAKGAAMTFRESLSDLVKKTPLVDTHEHLWEESERVKGKAGKSAKIHAPDFGMLLCHYADSDLQVAGMPPADFARLLERGIAPKDKWRLVAPYYERCRNTGYLRCVRESVRQLYGEDDLREDNVEAISKKLYDAIQPGGPGTPGGPGNPGYYRPILKDVANIEYAQVNSLETPVFMETAQPDLLMQDISTVGLATGLNVGEIATLAQREVATLQQWHGVIDWCFATYGPRAIATKNQSAYSRRLNYDLVKTEDAAPLFARFVRKHDSVSGEELKAIEDHLFHYCVDKAVEYRLPVKLHTGYYAGCNSMPLERLRQNAGDLCPIVMAHPDAQFVLMHIDYPYQDELIAMAKQHKNVYADMCWAWIINPAAGVRFMKEFLMAAPASKLFTFGGDYLPVELVPGHARIARLGITQAVAELTEEGWLAENDVPALIERVMRGNAHDLYEYDRALKNWHA